MNRNRMPDSLEELAIGVDSLQSNIYTDLAAQDERHSEEIANLTTAVNDLGNSLMELSDTSRTRTVNLVRSMDSTDQRVRDCENRLDSYSAENLEDDARLTDLNDRLRRVEKRLDNSATFGNRSIQDAFRLIREMRAELDRLSSLRSPAFEKWMAKVDTRLPGCDVPAGSAEGAMSHVIPAPVTGTPVAAAEVAPEVAKTAFTHWQERTRSDAEFLRFIATQKYSFPAMVRDGLLRIAERLDEAANGSDGSWV